ncbi:hypothetical protein GPALN_004115 [Globodera pallida]|nr:hypothetical protein GPALN_004115 [Globodera pallida]
MMKNDEEWNNVWKQLKTKLHSTMVAFGSGSVSLSKLMETFRNDWSTELTSYAVRLGYGSNDGAVYKMLLTMPDEIESGFISATATLAFKVVPKAETNDNLSKIDKSNQYQIDQRIARAQRRTSNGHHNFNNTFHAHPSMMPSTRPPFALSGLMQNAPRLSRPPPDQRKKTRAQRRASTGGHQNFSKTFHAHPSMMPSIPPSPLALSAPMPNPSEWPRPALEQQIQQIMRASKNRASNGNHHRSLETIVVDVTSSNTRIVNVTSSDETLVRVTSSDETLAKVTSSNGTMAKVTSSNGTMATVTSLAKMTSLATVTSNGTMAKVTSSDGTLAKVTSSDGTLAKVTSSAGTLAKVTSSDGTLAKVTSSNGTMAKVTSSVEDWDSILGLLIEQFTQLKLK